MGSKIIGGVGFSWDWKYRFDDAEHSNGKPNNARAVPRVSKNGQYYTVASRNVNLVVTANADDHEKERFECGFSNTVFFSERNYYYFSSERTRVRQHLSRTPVWDGDEDDDPPWYGGFANEYELGEENEFYFSDSPACMAFSESPIPALRNAKFGWERDPRCPSEKPCLFFIDGLDSFAAHFCIKDNKSGFIHSVDHVPWQVRYEAKIDPVSDKIELGPQAVTILGLQGRDYAPDATLDGHSCEKYDSVSYKSWTPATLPPLASARLRFQA